MSESVQDSHPRSPEAAQVGHSPKRSRWRRWRRRLLWSLGLSMLLVALMGPPLASIALRSIVEQYADEYLAVPYEIAEIDVDFFPPSVAFEGIIIGSPTTVSESQPILQLDKVSAGVSIWSVLSDTIVIPQVTVDGLHVHAQRLDDGSFFFEHAVHADRLHKLFKGPKGSDGVNLHCQHVGLTSINVTYEDTSVPETWQTRLDGLWLQIDDLTFATDNPSATHIAQLDYGLSQLHIGQPPGLSGQPLLTLDKLSLTAGPIAMSGETSILENLTLQTFKACFIEEADQKNSISLLSSHIASTLEGAAASWQSLSERIGLEQQPAAQDLPAEQIPVPELWLQDLSIGPGELLVVDKRQTPSDEILISNISLIGDNLRAGTQTDFDPGLLRLTGAVVQAAGSSLAQFRTTLRLPPTPLDKATIPSIDGYMIATGLIADTFSGYVGSAIQRSLGARGFDAESIFYCSPDQLFVRASVNSSAGTKYPLNVDGSMAEPKIDYSKFLFAGIDRLGGVAVNTGHSILHGAVEVLSGAGKAVTSIGEGIGDAALSVGKGTVKTVEGIGTLDVDKLGNGLTEATAGSVSSASDGVRKAGGEVVDGVTSSTKVGEGRFGRWLADSNRRYTDFITEYQPKLEDGVITGWATEGQRKADPQPDEATPPKKRKRFFHNHRDDD